MKTTNILVGAIALGLGSAVPLADEEYAFEKRQSNAKGVGSMIPGGFGGLGKLLGEPEALETLTGLARAMGANKNSGGSFGSVVTMMNSGYGRVADPPGAAPKRVVLKSQYDIPGAQTVKLRYGPIKVPNMGRKNMLGQAGMLFNYPQKNIQKPCEGECTLIGMTPGLEFPDGKNANVDSGLWLHHMILFNSGPGREDLTCNHRDVSIPHAVIGMTPRNSERIFASGNERTSVVFPELGVKNAGYKLKATDKFSTVLEFMNENREDKIVYLTMTYDFVPGYPFKDNIRILWFDVRQCGTSEVNPPKGKPQFSLDYTWNASFDGEIIGTAGHLHDGGTRTLLSVDGKQACDSTATYGGKPEFVAKPTAGGHSHGATTHISDMHICYGQGLPNGQMKKGQKWRLQADYDFNKFKGVMHEDGSLDEVMGIQLVFVKTK